MMMRTMVVRITVVTTMVVRKNIMVMIDDARPRRQHNNNREGVVVRLGEAKVIAERLKQLLMPCCERLQIVGSIRRSKPSVNDIDIVLIEKPDQALMLTNLISNLGTLKINGPKIKRVLLPDHNITLDIYIATPFTWATLLLIRTGSKENNISLCSTARRKGWHLKANGDGLFDEHGNRVAGDTEESIYEALGLPYQTPEERDALHSQISS